MVSLRLVGLAGLLGLAEGQVYGCMEPEADNYNADADSQTDIDRCYYCAEHEQEDACIAAGCFFGSGESPACRPYDIYGCRDTEADNYNVRATADGPPCAYCSAEVDQSGCDQFAVCTFTGDGCAWVAYGCTNPDADNYDPMATHDDSSCVRCEDYSGDVDGCNAMGCHYNSDATTTPACHSVGCPDPQADNYLPRPAVISPCLYCDAYNENADSCRDAGCTYLDDNSICVMMTHVHHETSAPRCPDGFALCPAVTATCTGRPDYPPVDPTCVGTTTDGYDCQAVFDLGLRQDRSTCPSECVYTNLNPTCTTAWLDDLYERFHHDRRPYRLCDEDGVQDDCTTGCPAGCDLRWDAPAAGPVGVCVPTLEAICLSSDGSTCNGFDGSAGSCPVDCTYTGPRCDSCEGYATATAVSPFGDEHLTCTHAPTCSDIDGDPSNGSPLPWSSCGAGQRVEEIDVPCGGGRCDRETCCGLYTEAQISGRVETTCPSRGSDLTDHIDEVQRLALRVPAEWMRASGEVQGLLMCLLEPAELDELCESRGIGGFQRQVLQEFCGAQIGRGLASCPTEEHHHCCSCHSNDYPLRPDDGHCCADCTETCSGAFSALPLDDLCDGVSGECDLIAFMRALMDTLGTEEIHSDPPGFTYASARDLVAPDKRGVFCACRAVGTKMILQGGPEREVAEAVQGDACLPDDHPAGGDTAAYEAGPCSTGVHVNLDGPDSTYTVSIGESSGYPAGPSECRWAVSCPAGSNPSLSFSHFMIDSHSLGRVAANGDLAAERDMAGECNPGEPSIEDFNNPSLYGPGSKDSLPQIRWEIDSSTPATTRTGVDVTAVRTTAAWEHLEYHVDDMLGASASICPTDMTGVLGNADVVCEDMVGTYSACENACSAISDCVAFSRGLDAATDGDHPCSLLANTAWRMDGEATVTYVKQHTTLTTGVWTRTGVGEGSTWLHENGCYELNFADDGFGITIQCSHLSPNDPLPSGPYTLHFKNDGFRCEPFEGRGDYIRLYDGRTIGEPFVDAVSDCEEIVELVAPVHTCAGDQQVQLCTGTATTLDGTCSNGVDTTEPACGEAGGEWTAGSYTPRCDLYSGTDTSIPATCPAGCTLDNFDCNSDWTSLGETVSLLDPLYSGPLDEFCPAQCVETRSPGQYSCSVGCEVEPAATTCMGVPFSCRPPLDTSGGLNYDRCFGAVDAASCTAMYDDTHVDQLLGCIALSTSDETCSSAFQDRRALPGARDSWACPLHEMERCEYWGPPNTCTNGDGQTTCPFSVQSQADCVDDSQQPCIFQDFTQEPTDMFTTCNAGFLDLLLSGTPGDHASICSNIASTCHYTPSMACETHHHAASCQPRPATFTGSNGDGTAPAVDSGIYSATGTHMLIAASIRGDEHNRAAARSACAESYRADLPEDERCGPTCVISTVVIDGGPAETCLPMSDVGGFSATVECVADGTGIGR